LRGGGVILRQNLPADAFSRQVTASRFPFLTEAVDSPGRGSILTRRPIEKQLHFGVI
jgi:hypothetical protein